MKTTASPNASANIASLWNEKYPVGTRVCFRHPVSGLVYETETSSSAYVLNGEAVVLLLDFSSEYPITLCSPVPPSSPPPVRSALMLEVWKNQAGWNWHMKAPGWVLFNAPDTRYRSRSDAQHAGERTASQLNITITEIKVR